MKEPSVSRYPLEIHCCAASPPPRLRSIAGRATLTTELSTVTTLEPRIAAMRMRRCCRVILLARATDALRRSFGTGASRRGVEDQRRRLAARRPRRAGRPPDSDRSPTPGTGLADVARRARRSARSLTDDVKDAAFQRVAVGQGDAVGGAGRDRSLRAMPRVRPSRVQTRAD